MPGTWMPYFRPHIVMLSLAWLVLCGQIMAATAEPSWDEAPLQETIVHDFGPVFPNAEVAHEFPITNESTRDWEILGTQTSCNCILASRLPPVLPPGVRSGFRLSFQAGTALTTQKTYGWIIKRTDGKVWRCPFLIQCQVADYLDLPQSVVRVDAAEQTTLMLKRGGHPDRWNRVRVDAGTWTDRFTVTMEPRPNDTWELGIAAVAGRHRGDFNGRLEFTYWDTDRCPPPCRRPVVAY